MKITFLGATHQVTGSCTLVETNGKKILIDCGMEQGPNIYDEQTLSFNAAEIDFVLLTHAHIDHSGLLPLLSAEGFKGEIYCTQATKYLCDIMLKDSAYIQERETEFRNRKAQRKDASEHAALYTVEDAEKIMQYFHTHEFRESFFLDAERNLKVRFFDAGHLLGSCFVELTLTEDGESRSVLFTGDIGNVDIPLMNEPYKIESADYLVMEATYGNRVHEQVIDAVINFAGIIEQTFDMGGKVIIPAFAVGRTQELLYYIREIKARNLVRGHGDFTVYVDSPLAIEATSIFEKVKPVYYNDEAKMLLKKGQNPISFPGLRLSVTQEDSRLINEEDKPCVIISASGMCEAGRIRHHLKHNLWKKQNTVVFSGFQVEGTLGHAILNGAKTVKILGEEISVNARIIKLEHISAHADRNGLLMWLKSFSTLPKKVFVIHGDDASCEAFAQTVRNDFNIDATAPFYKEEHDLLLGIKTRNGERKTKPAFVNTSNGGNSGNGERNYRSPKYKELLSAFSSLRQIVDASEGLANREMDKFIQQITELSKRWKD